MTEELPVQPPGRDHVSRDELEALIEDWRERAELHREFGYWKCADELEALLNDA